MYEILNAYIVSSVEFQIRRYVGGYIISAECFLLKISKLIKKGWLNIKTKTYYLKKKQKHLFIKNYDKKVRCLLKYIKQ